MPQLSTHSDEHLVKLLHENDDAAYTEIYNRYWKPLYTSANNILQVKEASQDVVQEVFVSLWKRRSEVQIESLRAYLYQATRFQVFKSIRAGKADRDFFSRLSVVSRDILLEDPLLFKELQHIYQHVLHTLPEDEQEIFRLHREEGLTYNEIAEAKGISVKTVEKKMSRALRQIRPGLDKALLIWLAIEAIKY